MPEKLKYVTLCLFVTGVILIVFLQFLSGENIDRLVSGNQNLLRELRLQNELRTLEADILTVESDIRALVISKDKAQRPAIEAQMTAIRQQSQTILQSLHEVQMAGQGATLNFFVSEKLNHSAAVLKAYDRNGPAAAAAVINSGRGKRIRDSIISVIHKFDLSRHEKLRQIGGSVESNALKARTWGIGLGVIAGLFCVLTFLYLMYTGRQQQLMIKKLNESEKQIRDSAAVKEQFLANMSHEIRTPMNAILGFTNLLKKTTLDTHQVQYVDFIHSSGENLLSLINDILDLSKIEAGMMQLERQPFSLNGLISSVEIMFRDKARNKGLQFEVGVDQSIHDTLSGDAIRLTQILINLLSNAIKFTDKGAVQLQVAPVVNSRDEVILRFAIRDTGIGIAAQQQQSIFERFQQADAETTRRFGGTGLGLSIVKQLVDMQGGTVDVESTPGEGTQFIVTLPFVPIFDHQTVHLAIDHSASPGLRDVQVLVAEDNIMNQHLIRHLMRYWRIDYTLVNNGREAVDALQKRRYSMVLMDIQMPEMDGYAATQLIRNDLKINVPIIAMTAHAMAGEKEKCLSFGMNEYISKPIKEPELYAMIEQYGNAVNPDTNPAEPVLNLQYLRELSLGDAEFEHAIIRQFIVQIPEELELLHEAITARRFIKIKSIAHGMKSSVAYMGLTERLNPFLQRMETEAMLQADPAHFEEDLVQVTTLCQQALAEARQLPVLVG